MWPFNGDAGLIAYSAATKSGDGDRVFESGCVESRREVSTYFFRVFNKSVFNNRLPANTAIFWNKRLLTTAGRCLQASIGDKRVAFIQLSLKICDTPERVRDTLLHEMCHAATWVLDGVQHTDHGTCFQYWAERASRIHPDLPQINSFHSYTIRKRFTYRCVQCKNRIDRHSKSIDQERQVCGLCGGKFKLVENRQKDEGESHQTKKSSSRRSSRSSSVARDSFAEYLRKNKQKMKRRHPRLSSHEIVYKLAQQFDRICKQ